MFFNEIEMRDRSNYCVLNEELARKLVEHLFSVGNGVDPADAYREFRGRDARIDALMRDRGFPISGQQPGAR